MRISDSNSRSLELLICRFGSVMFFLGNTHSHTRVHTHMHTCLWETNHH